MRFDCPRLGSGAKIFIAATLSSWAVLGVTLGSRRSC